jgi:hypothetical protein
MATTIKVRKDNKGNRVTSTGVKLPTGIYMRNTDTKNPTYRAVFYRNGKQIYVADGSSVSRLVRLRNEAMRNFDDTRRSVVKKSK